MAFIVPPSKQSDGKIGGMSAALRAASAKAAADDAEKQRQRRIEFHTELFGSTAKYDNAVILAGFAGFFALWAGAAGDVPRFARLIAVALMGVSLMTYIGSVVGQMLLRQAHLEWKRGDLFSKFANDPGAFNAAWDAIGRDYERRLGRLMPAFVAAFWVSLALGFAAALILAYNALGVDFGWPVLVGCRPG